MLTTTLTLRLSRSEESLRSAARYLAFPGWILRAGITAALIRHKLRRLAMEASDEVLRLVDMARTIDEQGPDLIDPDGTLAEHCADMLEKVKSLHRGMLEIEMKTRAEGIQGGRIAAAAGQLAAVYAEYHEAIAGFAWAVAEHDATYAPRLTGFVAHSAEEVGAMLDRITFG